MMQKTMSHQDSLRKLTFAAYNYNINPLNGSSMWPHLEGVNVPLPPKRRRGPGRPKTKRHRAASEKEDTRHTVSKKGQSQKCSLCGVSGHNKSKCPLKGVTTTTISKNSRGEIALKSPDGTTWKKTKDGASVSTGRTTKTGTTSKAGRTTKTGTTSKAPPPPSTPNNQPHPPPPPPINDPPPQPPVNDAPPPPPVNDPPPPPPVNDAPPPPPVNDLPPPPPVNQDPPPPPPVADVADAVAPVADVADAAPDVPVNPTPPLNPRPIRKRKYSERIGKLGLRRQVRPKDGKGCSVDKPVSLE